MTRFTRILLVRSGLADRRRRRTPQRETVDRIIAVVGNEVILASELAGQLQIVALQTGRRPQTEEEVIKLRDRCARSDGQRPTLPAGSPQRYQHYASGPKRSTRRSKSRCSASSSRFGSAEEFSAALAKEGLTTAIWKKRYRPDIENQTAQTAADPETPIYCFGLET